MWSPAKKRTSAFCFQVENHLNFRHVDLPFDAGIRSKNLERRGMKKCMDSKDIPSISWISRDLNIYDKLAFRLWSWKPWKEDEIVDLIITWIRASSGQTRRELNLDHRPISQKIRMSLSPQPFSSA